MRFNEYIDSIKNVDEIVEMIKKDCPKSFLSQTKGGFFYRGYDVIIKDIKKIKPRKNRMPKDMPQEIHEELDILFKKKFGWKARSEGIFATGNFRISLAYGKCYLFFPISEYKFIWSPGIKDLYIKIKDEAGLYTDETMAYIHKCVDSYRDSNLTKALKSGSEMMFKCKEYYLVDLRYAEDLKDKLWR